MTFCLFQPPGLSQPCCLTRDLASFSPLGYPACLTHDLLSLSAPWRVLAADYNTSLIILSCMDEQRDGSCSAQGLKLHFLAREPHPDPSLRQQLYGMLGQSGCFHHIQMEDVHHEGE